MGWLSKLIVVDNLRRSKYKQNSVEFLIDFKKKNYPQIKSICWDLLTLIKSYSQVCYKKKKSKRRVFSLFILILYILPHLSFESFIYTFKLFPPYSKA
jgi:hypothetical protein